MCDWLQLLAQYSPNGGVKWLLPKPWISSIGQCAQYGTGTPLQPLKWPAKLVHFIILVLFAVALAAASPVASGVALDILHQAMPSVFLQCTCMATKWPATEVHFFYHHLFCLT
jgi:hypothetical protein